MESLLTQVKEALELATTATALDNAGNYAGAYDYYDLTILSLNEALQEVSEGSRQAEMILRLRSMYDDRLTLLHDSSKYDIGGMIASVGDLSIDGSGRTTGNDEGEARTSTSRQTPKKKKARRASRVPFAYEAEAAVGDKKDASWNDVEKPPTVLVLQPYWQLRMLSATIRTGGFITPTIHVPKVAWSLPGSKLGGIGAKTSAFEHINAAVDQFIAPLTLKGDGKNLERALLAFHSTENELAILQNTLHKSFPYVAEVPLPNQNTDVASAQGGGILGRIGSFGKSVRKIAEVGYSRLGAMQTRVSLDDMHSYANLVASVCDRAQLFVVWYDFCNSQRDKLLSESSGGMSAEAAEAISTLENLIMSQIHVSTFMREVLCELLLRDLETLLARHMEKMRKSFSRMYWSDDENDDDV